MATPRVSVVIPCCNYGRYLEEAVQSVLLQDFADFEVVIVDDGSTDDTPLISARLAAVDERVTVVRTENSGQPAIARNHGLLRARGDLFVCLDADDRLGSGYLTACVDALHAHPTVSIAYPDQIDFGDRDEVVPHPSYDASKLPLFNFIPPTAMFRRAAFDDVGGFRVNVVGYEDWDFWVACLAAGHVGVHVPEAVWHYRRHDGGLYDTAVPDDRRLKAAVVLNNPSLYSPEQITWAKAVECGDPAVHSIPDSLGVVPVFVRQDSTPQPAAPMDVTRSTKPRHVLFFMYGWAEEGGGTILPRQIARELARRGDRVSVIYAAAQEAPGRGAFWIDEHEEEEVSLFGVYNRPALFADPLRPDRESDDREARRAVGLLLDRLQPDVAHVHSFLGFSMGLLDELDSRGIPAFYTSHNYWPVCPRMYLFESELELCEGPMESGRNCAACLGDHRLAEGYAHRLERGREAMSRRLHRHLAVSHHVRDRFVAAGFDGGNIEVLQQQPETVDATWRHVGEKRQIVDSLDRPLRVGFIGSVVPQKGVHVLAKAAQHLGGRVEIHVFGGGSAPYEQLIRNLDGASVVTFHGRYETDALPELLGQVDVVAVPSIWEDCAPLVVAEALAARCPVIGSRIGGITDFIREGETGLLPAPRDPASLGGALAAFLDDPTLLGRMQRAIEPPRGFAAHVDDLQRHYGEVAMTREIPEAKEANGFHPTADGPKVVWEGSQFVRHSLAIVNREICQRLIDRGTELSIELYEPHQFRADGNPALQALEDRFRAPLSGTADVHVRHMWPPRLDRPAARRWVIVQPWEFGAMPMDWVEPFRDEVDEIWVPTSYVRECYVAGGVPAEKIVVVPNGVDVETFRPEGDMFPLVTKKTTKFLFVGGTIARKGIEVLLEAYTRAFTPDDDVCLVIKDTCADTVYRHSNARTRILELMSDPRMPEIEYLEEDLDAPILAGLYRACDVLVHPYLGEGFGMPIAEAMASGKPVVVTGMGAALDFCDEETGWLIPARKIETASRRVGDLECVGTPWVALPDVEALIAILRSLPGAGSERFRRGAAGRKRILESFTWEHVVSRVEERLTALTNQKGDDDMTSDEHDTRMAQDLLAPAITAVQAGDLEGACREFERLTAEHPDLVAGHAGLGTIRQRLGRHCEAAAAMQAAANLAPEDANIVNQAGVASFRAGAMGDARSAFERACEMDEGHLEARLNLGRLEQTEGHHDVAAGHVVEVLERAPGDPSALALYGHICIDVGFEEGLSKAVLALESVAPDHPELSTLRESAGAPAGQ